MTNQFQHHAHLSVRHSNTYRLRGYADIEMLLRGTPEEIANHIANTVKNALGNGGISEIRVIPVPPHQLWDLEKNPPQ